MYSRVRADCTSHLLKRPASGDAQQSNVCMTLSPQEPIRWEFAQLKLGDNRRNKLALALFEAFVGKVFEKLDVYGAG